MTKDENLKKTREILAKAEAKRTGARSGASRILDDQGNEIEGGDTAPKPKMKPRREADGGE